MFKVMGNNLFSKQLTFFPKTHRPFYHYNDIMQLSEFIDNYDSLTNKINCLCGSKRHLPIKPRERFSIPVQFSMCTQCGHVYASNPMRADALDTFYSSALYRDLYSSGFTVEDHIAKLNVAYRSKTPLWNISESVLPSSGGYVLEWGCGGGWNLIPFRDFGHTVVGMDVNDPYIEAGRRILNLDLRTISTQTLNEISKIKFDLIILNHVLEHLLNPEDLLNNLKRLCSTSTKFVIGLPTLETIKEYGFDRYFTIAHIHYFSKTSFSRFLSRCGLSVESTHKTQGGLTFVVGFQSSNDSRRVRLGFLKSLFLITRSFSEFHLRKFVKHLLLRTKLIKRFR